MPSVRLTAFFRDDDGHGFSETHDIDGGASIISLTPFLTNFDALMVQKRRPLLAADGFYLGCRASYRTADGSLAGDNKLQDLALSGPQTVAQEKTEMDACQIAVKSRFVNGASTAHSEVYIRAIPRQIATAGQLDFGSPVGKSWKSKLDAYEAALIANGYGWVGVSAAATPRGTVTTYAANPAGTVTFTVQIDNGVPMPTPPAGKTLHVAMQVSRLNNSKSILNRTWICSIDSPTTLTTIAEVAASDFVTKGTFAVLQKALIPYAAVSYHKLSSRKTGKVFGVGRGRLPARTLH